MGINATFVQTLVAILLLEHIPGSKATLRCYKCFVAAPVINYENSTIRLCKDFDYSENFIVDCPYSTFCMKKVVSAKIPYPINGTERDCANQKRKQQNYYNKQWHVEYVIEDPYEEGCETLDDKGARTTTTESCYCRGDLCNNVDTSRGSAMFYAVFAVIVLISRPILCRVVVV